MDKEKKILVYGYGNPGRQDDGLGAAFVHQLNGWIEENNRDEVHTDTNYQLNIEDAATIQPYSEVVFVDASTEDIDAFAFDEVKPDSARLEFTMHAVSPAFVVDLCQKIYGLAPPAKLLHIKGYEWDFKEELTGKAQQNLQKAFRFLTHYFSQNNN